MVSTLVLGSLFLSYMVFLEKFCLSVIQDYAFYYNQLGTLSLIWSIYDYSYKIYTNLFIYNDYSDLTLK